ncbi:hypothetical protein ACT3RP_15040 [Halomonas sp. AOP5-B2-8]
MIKLGLVGEGIAKSQSPDLHERLSASLGLPVRYDLVDSLGVADFDFPSAIEQLHTDGYLGTNVTFPFKEKAAQLADVRGEGVLRVGTANTLLFDDEGLRAARASDSCVNPATSERDFQAQLLSGLRPRLYRRF